ncbi:MAG: ribosome recycling factor [Flavobacteriales bacterium]|nr:ribosome recycling factor [Flavobacteriales bacterium]
MEDELEMIFDDVQDQMRRTMSSLETELSKIRAGKATPSMLDSVFVDYYGSQTPLNQVANVNTPDGRTISIQPWEKEMLEPIEKGIMHANLGLNPQNNGELIMISVPMLTEERRRELVKQSKAEGENSKVSIRNARKDANEMIKKLKADGLSEDSAKDSEDQIQNYTNEYTKKCERFVELKEIDIMKV